MCSLKNVVFQICLVGTLSLRLQPAPRMSAPGTPTSVSRYQTQAEVECVSEAENPAEADDCMLPAAAVAAGTVAPQLPKMTAEKRGELMGKFSDSVDTCLSEAEGSSEQEDCLLDYEELVSGKEQ
jgi:hypothetical protein